jgi:pimeloyl-ACP methyl ester carboxylesterase
VLLHGGPGVPGSSFRPIEALAESRPVIRYDQLGCGRSDRPADRSLWQIGTFVEELDTLRDALGLDEIHLLGHSWGGTLALEYVLGRRPGIRSLILSSALYSTRVFAAETRRLCEAMPSDFKAIVRRFEQTYRPSAAGPSESEALDQPGIEPARLEKQARVAQFLMPLIASRALLKLMRIASLMPPLRHAAYTIAEIAFLRRHLCRLPTWPLSLFADSLGRNLDVYETMWGRSEFVPTGNLLDWNVEDRLGEIDVPTLILSGRHDESTPMQQERLAEAIAGSRRVLFEDSAHFAFLEEPERYRQVLADFLDEREGRSA